MRNGRGTPSRFLLYRCSKRNFFRSPYWKMKQKTKHNLTKRKLNNWMREISAKVEMKQKTKHNLTKRKLNNWMREISAKVEPRFNEGPRDWQNLFALTRLRYIEVRFNRGSTVSLTNKTPTKIKMTERVISLTSLTSNFVSFIANTDAYSVISMCNQMVTSEIRE